MYISVFFLEIWDCEATDDVKLFICSYACERMEMAAEQHTDISGVANLIFCEE